MAKIIAFKKPAVKKLGLCQFNHHKWVLDKKSNFDSKQGRLVNRYVCANCGKTKVCVV